MRTRARMRTCMHARVRAHLRAHPCVRVHASMHGRTHARAYFRLDECSYEREDTHLENARAGRFESCTTKACVTASTQILLSQHGDYERVLSQMCTVAYVHMRRYVRARVCPQEDACASVDYLCASASVRMCTHVRIGKQARARACGRTF